MADFLVLLGAVESLQNGAGSSGKTKACTPGCQNIVKHSGVVKKKEWPQCHKECTWKERQSHICQKEQSERSHEAIHMIVGFNT